MYRSQYCIEQGINPNLFAEKQWRMFTATVEAVACSGFQCAATLKHVNLSSSPAKAVNTASLLEFSPPSAPEVIAELGFLLSSFHLTIAATGSFLFFHFTLISVFLSFLLTCMSSAFFEFFVFFQLI